MRISDGEHKGEIKETFILYVNRQMCFFWNIFVSCGYMATTIIKAMAVTVAIAIAVAVDVEVAVSTVATQQLR